MKTLNAILSNVESRKKFLFTLGMMLIVLIGGQIPTYGVNTSYFSEFFSQNGSLSFFNALTGNSLGRLSLFALSITPYITASIIIQLLMVAIPKLESMVKDNIDGQEKLEKMNYIVAGVLGFMEALAMSIGFGKKGLLLSYTWYNCLIVTVLWGGCSLLLIFIGKMIDKKGIGNGISLILLFNILSSIPSDAITLYDKFCSNQNIPMIIVRLAIICVIVLCVFCFSILLNDSEKRVPIQYSKGTTYMGAQRSFIPIKVCIAGVLPVIFASSLMSFPILIVNMLGLQLTGWKQTLLMMLNSSYWFDMSTPICSIGYVIYALLVIFFGYFYASITFNSYEIAENLKKSGGTICGIRPGKPTVEYFDKQVKYLIFIGTAGLLIIATVPIVVSGIFSLGSLSFGGTSIMIISSVILETKKQFELEAIYHKASIFNRQKSSIFGFSMKKEGI